ncbi:MAG: hypothetical protein M1834_008961, partial [Cirrosporium novae-zelandiae]
MKPPTTLLALFTLGTVVLARASLPGFMPCAGVGVGAAAGECSPVVEVKVRDGVD